jgi:transglutaminase-like putative cysteine protease
LNPVVRILTLLILLLSITIAHADDHEIARAPDWILRQPYKEPGQIPESQISNGVYYILLDRQVKVGRQQTHTYHRVIKKVLSPQGVENASQVYINFDPTYERLVLHRIVIHRGGGTIDQLQLDKITFFQRESDLERRIYNGEKTASIILEGTRPGDLIEYAYTISGRNPVFKSHYADEVDTAWSAPLSVLHYRWLFTNGRPVFHRAYNCRKKLVKRKLSNGVEYRYADQGIGTQLVDEDLPAWYVPYPRLQITQFMDWTDVGRWGTALYPIPQEVSPALQTRIDALHRIDSAPEKIAKALCLVQNEIRYLGIEIGAGSYKPTAPDVTYRRKFGDCKDKTILLCTMLNKLGIRAYPALVHTRLKRTISEMLPSPLLFNHVIVCARHGDKTYWIDPTADCQELPLDKQYLALYGKALVLEKGVHDLTDTGQLALSEPSKEIIEQFDLTKGINQPASFTVKTIFRGRDADHMRYQIRSTGLQQTAKSYLNYYASDYPSIEQRQVMTTESNPATNTLIVTEHYRIPDFWLISKDEKHTTGVFHVKECDSLFQLPATTIRTMPIGLAHPQYIVHRVTAQLPEHWNIAQDKWRVENEALLFTGAVSYENKVLNLAYTYRSKKDYVPLGQCAAYIADLKTIKKQIGYQISWAMGAPGISWLMIVAVLVGLVASVSLAITAWRYDPWPNQIPILPHENRDLEGLGGWLVLVMIGLFVQPVIALKALIELRPVFGTDYWLNCEGMIRTGYMGAFRLLVGGEIAANLIFITLFVALIYLYFKKRTAFPRLFIAVTLCQLVLVAIDTTLADFFIIESEPEPGQDGEMARDLISSAIWCVYMVKSKRVQCTFTRRRRRKVHQDHSKSLSTASDVE